MALHINRSKHFQFCRKNADWHLSVQYLYFTKLQGRHHVQIIPLNDYICTHTLAGLITPKYFLLLNVCPMCLTSKSYYRIVTETRATTDRWTWCIYLANKNVFGLRDTYVLFFFFFSKMNEWLSVFTEQSHKAMININFEEDKQETIKPHMPLDLVYESWQIKKVHRYIDCI